jgi:glycerophosphoryl diester phosphodiesterase
MKSTLLSLLLAGLATFWPLARAHPHDPEIPTAFQTAGRPFVIAHRGGAKESTENTIAAFQRAVSIGADGIETDLQLTRDGVIVIYHDDRLGRVEGLVLDKPGPLISDLTYEDLTRRTLSPIGEDRGGRRVPKLADLLREVKSGLLNIELKRGARFDDLVEKTIAELKDTPAFDRIVLEPPDIPTAEKLRAALGPQLKIHINPGYDTSVPYDVSMKRVLAFKPHSLSVSYRKLSWEIVDLAHKAGVEVWVWTVDQPAVAQAMALLGVDAIKTDLPTTMLKQFNRSR